MATSCEAHARATTTGCAEPTTASWLTASVGEIIIAPTHMIFYLETLMKTGSRSIDGIMRRRRILFAGFVARIENTR